MSAEAWIAMTALVFTMFASSIIATMTILTRINKNKEELDEELSALRLAAYEEYKTLRKEISDVAAVSRREFGESIHAIREKVTQVELWTRDQLMDTRSSLGRSIDSRLGMAMDKIEKTDSRVRQLELFTAKVGYTFESKD